MSAKNTEKMSIKNADKKELLAIAKKGKWLLCPTASKMKKHEITAVLNALDVAYPDDSTSAELKDLLVRWKKENCEPMGKLKKHELASLVEKLRSAKDSLDRSNADFGDKLEKDVEELDKAFAKADKAEVKEKAKRKSKGETANQKRLREAKEFNKGHRERKAVEKAKMKTEKESKPQKALHGFFAFRAKHGGSAKSAGAAWKNLSAAEKAKY